MRNRISQNLDWQRLDRLDDLATRRAVDRVSDQLEGIARAVLVAGATIATGLVAIAVSIWLTLH